jgi:hypothetical protein
MSAISPVSINSYLKHTVCGGPFTSLLVAASVKCIEICVRLIRLYATSRKVAVSVADGVNLPNP